ncbi:BnaC09g11550D [Brassica napus]|uniref:BnaC09g11550D protein n=1 Tax=Brassica napus TaxID=3708 RepID=A0A078GGJ0_BRANA|nr:BnaC09g11550D [Brassica napus]
METHHGGRRSRSSRQGDSPGPHGVSSVFARIRR